MSSVTDVKNINNLDKDTSDKKKERTNAANAIIIKQGVDGKRYFLLGLRAKHKSGGGQWGLVGGTQSIGEPLEETLQRELLEEIGINVEIDDIVWNNWFQCVPVPSVHFDHHGFVVSNWTGEIVNNEPDKCDELRWFAEDELPWDNMFVSKVNLHNFVNNVPYDSKNNIHYLKKSPTM